MIKACLHFWFETIDARQLAALRIFFGSFTVYYLQALFPLLELHYSDAGWLAGHSKISYFNAGAWSLLAEFSSLNASRIFVVVAILSAIGFTVGYRTRLCGVLSYIALVSIWNKNPLLLDGDDALLRMMIFYLMLAGSGNVWSMDARFKTIPQLVEIWPLRLIQLQMALLYFVSGWVKFHSNDWYDGAIFNQVLVHPEYARGNLLWLLNYSWMQESLGYVSWFIRYWELLFPLLIIHPLSRKITIVVGVMFHLGLVIFMNLRGFCLIMLGLYLALLPNQFFKNLLVRSGFSIENVRDERG